MLKEAWRENENWIRAQRVSSRFVPEKCDLHLGREGKKNAERMDSEYQEKQRGGVV